MDDIIDLTKPDPPLEAGNNAQGASLAVIPEEVLAIILEKAVAGLPRVDATLPRIRATCKAMQVALDATRFPGVKMLHVDARFEGNGIGRIRNMYSNLEAIVYTDVQDARRWVDATMM